MKSLQDQTAMITILIPTMNRPDFLIRLMHYYYRLRFQGCLFIGDSSSQGHLARTKAAIEQYRDRLNIVHNEYPGLNHAQCMHLMLGIVSTPYAAYIADDDFLVPKSLRKCAEFLDRNHDYSAAHGVGITLQLESSGPFGEPALVSYYSQAEIEGETAAQRLINYSSNLSGTQFSVHRTESWRVMYRDVTTIRDEAFGSEILPCYLSAVLGKVRSLNGLYLIRQLHDQQYITRSESMEWITSPDWQPSYQAFCASVAAEIVRQDGVDLEQATKLIQIHFRENLQKMLITKSKQARSRRVRLRRLFETAPWFPYLRRFRQNWLGSSDALSLPVLLKPSSQYYADFMDAYRAFTVRPPEASTSGQPGG